MTLETDLFGVAVTVSEPRLLTAGGNVKRKETPNGYAARPGSGPAGETCKTCEFKYQVEIRSGRKFWKCLKVQHRWSGCYASDIRLKSPACSFWEQALSKTPRKLGLGLRRRSPLEMKELR